MSTTPNKKPRPSEFGWTGTDENNLATGTWSVGGGENEYYKAIADWEIAEDDRKAEEEAAILEREGADSSFNPED